MDRIGTAWEEDGGTPLELTCRVFAQCVAVSRSMGGIVRPADRAGLKAGPSASTGSERWMDARRLSMMGLIVTSPHRRSSNRPPSCNHSHHKPQTPNRKPTTALTIHHSSA